MSLSGRITEWNRERGFGYLDNDGQRIFLHIREFKERHKQPEVGDAITFVMGSDQQGRPCAQQAVHLNDGGRYRVWHFILLGALMVLPFVAIYQVLGTRGLLFVGGWMLGISALTYLLYFLDKRQARAKTWREPERMLHLLELMGGWPGAFLAQCEIRHKSTKPIYQIVFILIIGLHQIAAIDALRGWPFIKQLLRVLTGS